MAVFISIGNNCVPKYHIDKEFGKKETLFFDWLMTDMNSVISILSCSNIKDILNKDTVIRDVTNPTHDNNSRILVMSLSNCISIHDVKIEFDETDILEFIDKYTLRYYRILNYIKSDQTLYFVRNGKITEDEKNRFIKTILNINPSANFYLICIVESDKDSISKYERYITISFDKETHVKIPNDWKMSHLNWKQFFIEIKKLTE